MKTRTILPDPVMSAAVNYHLSLIETGFYRNECQGSIINELDVIEFMGELLLPKFIKGEGYEMNETEFKSFLQEIITFVSIESLLAKKVIGSIEIDGKDRIFLTQLGRELFGVHKDAA